MSIQIDLSEDIPGTTDGLIVRMYKTDEDYGIIIDRYCAMSDKNNKASQIQMFKSLIQMIKEVTAAPLPVEEPSKNDK